MHFDQREFENLFEAWMKSHVWNKWIECGSLSIYLRKSQIVRGRVEIGSVEVRPVRQRRKGIFKAALRFIESKADIVMVECVHNKQLRSFLERDGFQRIEDGMPWNPAPSYTKVLRKSDAKNSGT